MEYRALFRSGIYIYIYMPFKHATLLQASEVGGVVAVADLASGGKGSSASHARQKKRAL